ncbi:MAG: D-TA family PLP-dependent enzyme [Cytophagales bacterium]|nr:MAG: D-TA family PLP-dependent enzyme [Cytophagales bacterium]
MGNRWFEIRNEQDLDTPSLLIFKERVQHNIENMLRITTADRLMPHVKTYKMIEIVQMQLAMGITKFKAATIAEAEMVAMAGGKFVLIAHQLVRGKAERLALLQAKYPTVHFASLVDCVEMAAHLNLIFAKHKLIAHVFIDVNNAMNRSGHEVNDSLIDFYTLLANRDRFPSLVCNGLHAYDGNFRQTDFLERKKAIDEAFLPVQKVIEKIAQLGFPKPMIICGGTPAFTTHALRNEVYCSPGTCLVSDWGYGESLPEQNFEWAGILLTSVISKPKKGYITLDLGHKAVAAENPIEKRVKFLNLENYRFVSQSEEHLVLEVADWEDIKIGQLLYGVPYHICPTINLYQEVYIVENQEVIGTWQVIARNRRIY